MPRHAFSLAAPSRALTQALVVAVLIAFAVFTGRCRSANADSGAPLTEVTSTLHMDAGVTGAPIVGSSLLPSAGQLPDPAESPLAAIGDVKLLARAGWAATVFGVLLMVTKLLAYLSSTSLQNAPGLGAVATWLAVGSRTVIVSGLSTVAAAGYNAVLLGGSWAAALLAAGVAVVGLVHPTTATRSSSS
jgi:hypothetical protein